MPARPAPEAWPGGKAGRSAADRAGGADGPTAPTQWGPGRPGAPTPQAARGRSKARPHEVRPLAGLALLCGKVPPSNAAAQLDRAGLARPWAAHYPDRRRRAGRAATSRPGRAGERPGGRWGREGRPKGPDGSPHHRRRRWPPWNVARAPGVRGL